MKTNVGAIQSKEKKKSYIIGDNHLNRKCKDKLKERLSKARVYVKYFSGANTNQINHYMVSVLVDEKPNNVVIHNGSSDVTKFHCNSVNAEELDHRIRNIGWKSSNIAISSISERNSFNINQVIYQLNNILKHLCRLNYFFYICNDLLNEHSSWSLSDK